VSSTERPVANPIVVLREEFDDWAILFNPDTAEAMGINPVGVVIWKLMDGARSVDEIACEIKNRFADVPGDVTQEVAAFVDDLTGRGFAGYEIN
jgi:SynChlorMet cassette protein ScmD